MRLRRAGMMGGTICLVLAVLLVMPATAQSVNKELIEKFNTQLLYVALPLMLFVEVILVYAVVRFRNNDDPLPTTKDPSLEITWTVVTAIILLFVGVAAYTVLANPYITPEQPMNTNPSDTNTNGIDADADADGSSNGSEAVVNVLAYQWGWQFTYPRTNITTQNQLVIPVDTNVRLRMTSVNVIYSLFIPKLGVKQDIFPGRTTVIRTRVYEPGQYRLFCTEFCGSNHARMQADVRVVSESEYRQWLRQQHGPRNTTSVPVRERRIRLKESPEQLTAFEAPTGSQPLQQAQALQRYRTLSIIRV